MVNILRPSLATGATKEGEAASPALQSAQRQPYFGLAPKTSFGAYGPLLNSRGVEPWPAFQRRVEVLGQFGQVEYVGTSNVVG